MAQRARRFRNAHFILATAAGLIVLVSLALGGLGWRLVKQEEAVQKQQARDALEGKANILQTQFFSRMAETETLLRGLEAALPPGTAAAFGDGSVVVSMKTGIEVQSPGQLLYLPFVRPTPPLDESVFAEAAKLEFQSRDLNAASSALAALAVRHPMLRAEVLLRLGRVYRKSGRFADALATYAKFENEKTRIPVSEAPYGVISRLQRVELLKESGKPAEAQQEAMALIQSLNDGEWAIDKAVYRYHYGIALGLAGRPAETSAPPAKLAVTEMAESLWDEWRQFARTGSQSLTKQLHRSGPVPVLTIVHANPERLVAVIYAGEALRRWIPDPATASETSGIRVDLTNADGHGLLGGTPPASSQARVVRSLSPANLPWQLVVTSLDDSTNLAFATDRRNNLVLILVAIVLMVALACYALARGVLREAAAGQLQSDFVSAVSHEFRSPLTTLRQLTELLAEGRIVDEGRRRQYFSVLQKETSRLHRLVEDLLDFGRMDAGRRQYQLETLDLAVVVSEVVQQYEGEAGANGHTIEVVSRKGPLLVDADREALQRVVRNLLENAVKYSPDSKSVWVETDREAREAVLRVRDRGIGIPPEERKRIFEKFVRGEAAKQAAIPGTGIGLAMVQEIVRVHHGVVDVSSEVGAGSTFVVRVPLSHHASSPEVQETETVHGGAR